MWNSGSFLGRDCARGDGRIWARLRVMADGGCEMLSEHGREARAPPRCFSGEPRSRVCAGVAAASDSCSTQSVAAGDARPTAGVKSGLGCTFVPARPIWMELTLFYCGYAPLKETNGLIGYRWQQAGGGLRLGRKVGRTTILTKRLVREASVLVFSEQRLRLCSQARGQRRYRGADPAACNRCIGIHFDARREARRQRRRRAPRGLPKKTRRELSSRVERHAKEPRRTPQPHGVSDGCWARSRAADSAG